MATSLYRESVKMYTVNIVNLKYFKYYQDHIIVIIIILLSHYIKVIILLYRVGYYKHGVYYFGVG